MIVSSFRFRYIFNLSEITTFVFVLEIHFLVLNNLERISKFQFYKIEVSRFSKRMISE